MRLPWPSKERAPDDPRTRPEPPSSDWLETAAPARAVPIAVPLRSWAPSRTGLLGAPALDRLLGDDTVSEIMVNGPDEVWVERAGRLERTDVTLADVDEVQRIINRVVLPLGRRCDATVPLVDARLPDGSRVHAVVPPVCLNGPTLTIRKFSRTPLSARDLVQRGTASAEILELLQAAVRGRLNVVVSGGTGSGKTTLLNVLSSFIPDGERVVTIEDAAELRLQQRHVVALEARPANTEAGAITVRELVTNALRMRPDRIVVGECRAGEALDMLQAMSTGHDGSLTTVHANGPRDALRRIETMALMSGLDLPVRAIRQQIAAAIQVIVHMERQPDGTRRVVRVCEVTGLDHDVIAMAGLFHFQADGVGEGGVRGRHVASGVRPQFCDRLVKRGINVPARVFGA